ncbi:beta-galactosidase [Leifsonia sp. F6_8S_P_1B]|uniref:Beta-galactosidase n=1 Tax=Leifsonia williamsii TaxID=3035919 RepID=A0ABT8K5T6_9MICO|nr:beta-galactosidase [Leifsonia williamsii]MDN4612828.1 beta-galactosidase [Leifsonia williamsii]
MTGAVLAGGFAYGGDYNPEQWAPEVWRNDVELMNRAGVNLVSVGIFSWARIEPREGEFDFAWLDEVLDLLHAGGVRVDLATATASPPPWLAIAHPEVLPVTAEGVTLSSGSRQAYCPSSPVYRRYAARLVEAIVERYADHPVLELWHINNEYGCHVSHCYCDASAAAFRRWLEAKYTTVDALNDAWGTAFWSQHYDSFDEVLPPRAAPTFRNPTQLLDFDRFSSDELLDCFRMEKAIIRSRSSVPVTTNFMGFFKPADYWAWAQEVDVVSDDSYPDPADPRSPVYAAMQRDLMRSLGGGAPWLLMEQSPGAVNWRERNAAKLPGQMRAWSYQSIARGADGILFFQWRQAVAGAEKFHSGMVPHGGTDTRVFREVEQLGGELRALSTRPGLLGARVPAQVAIVFDWDSWWAVEQEASPARTSYLEEVFSWYAALAAAGVTVDFVRAGGDLTGYRAVVAPTLFVAGDPALEALDRFARDGGTLVVGFLTGVLDPHLHVRTGGYLGPLRDTLGVWIEEFAPPAAPDLAATGGGEPPAVAVRGDVIGGAASAAQWAEYVRAEAAEVEAVFDHGPLSGHPAITRRSHGEGSAWYIATRLDPEPLARLLDAVLTAASVERRPSIAGVELVQRGDVLAAINHSPSPVTLDLPGTDLLTGASATGLELGPQGVALIVE